MSKSEMRETLLRDMAEMHWLELERIAPEGALVCVGKELELIAVAEQIALDNTPQVKQWMESGQLYRPEEKDSQAWGESNAKFLCVIVKPFVLIQHIVAQA